MAKPAGSRLVIATLFLPETVNFDEPASPLPPPSEQLHDEDEPVNGDASASNDGSRIKTGASNSVAWPTSRTALSEDVAARPLSPIIASQPGTPNGQQSHFPLSFDGQNAPSAAENSRAKPSSQPGARQTNALQLAAMPSIQAIQSESSGRATSTLGVPTRPPLAGRGMSILDDLRTKATATPGVPIPKVTPSDLSLGYNPFEAALSAGAAPPVPTLPTTPSLQASIAMRRPNPARLLSEGHPSLGLSNSRYGGASNRDGVSGAGGILGRDASKPGEHGGSILTRTPAQSTDKTSPLSGMAATAQSQRPRATSITRPGSATGTGPGQLTRTFSRSGRRDSHRRRSSTASAAGMHGGSDSGLTTPLTPYGSQPGLPQFYLESNPHGNGGLQNAVRSVADAHIRTASDPIPPRLGRSAPERASTGEVAAEDRPIRSTHVSSIPSAKDGIREYRWVGTIGCGIGELDEPLRNAIDTKYREEKRSHAVWVEDDVLEPAYDMFCKQILWPTFHYQVHDVHKTKAYQSPAWKDYVAMNQAFADKIVSVYKKGDLIWINDYHLMLVPNMVRHKLPDATIGFFLHIAFPSSEIFRCLANRRELLEGVLGADLIGFQTYNLARHFRQTCQRLLSVEAIPRGIQLQNGFAKVGVFSIGIDVKALHERKREAEVGEWLKILREQYKGMRILMARDKLDEIKGVRQKLVAYEYFLEHNPEYVGKVVLIQVAMATSEENEKQGDVMDLVSRINARFSTFSYQPVVFLHQDVSFSQYLALLQVAECFINSSLREGMNLTSHEYIICQEGQWGPLILSEFTGSYSRAGFQRCIPVNPYDKKNFGLAIREALDMPEEERISRWRDLERHVWSQTAQHWCSSFINALQREVVDVTSRPLASPSLLQQSTSPAFDTDLAKASYATAGKRLILLDLEGTLCDSDARLRTTTETSENIDEFKLSDSTAKILEDLAGDKKNCVYILSGYSARSLSALTRRFPDIGYVAENGCFLALPAKSISEDRVWHSLVDESHNQWRQPVLNALRYYTERTPGSCIDDRGLSIVWRYADVLDSDHARTFKTPVYDDKLVSVVDAAKMPIAIEDSEAYEWARRQAAEVQNHIMDSLGERFGLRLHPGATSFLILPRKAGRAMAVGHILQKDNFLEEDMPIPERPNPTRPPFTHAQSEADLHEDAEIQDDDNPVDPDDSLPLPAEQDAGVVHAPRRTDVRRVSNKQNLRPKELDKVLASRRLQEQYDYVLAIGEDQRLCSWLGDMALDTVVTVSVGGKKRGARWQLRGPAEVTKALAGLAEVA